MSITCAKVNMNHSLSLWCFSFCAYFWAPLISNLWKHLFFFLLNLPYMSSWGGSWESNSICYGWDHGNMLGPSMTILVDYDMVLEWFPLLILLLVLYSVTCMWKWLRRSWKYNRKWVYYILGHLSVDVGKLVDLSNSYIFLRSPHCKEVPYIG